MGNAQLLAVIAAVAAPVIELVYAAGEHYGLWDRLTGRDHALEGVKRLKSARGYPETWIYNDEKDRDIFRALEKRISPRIEEEKLLKVLDEGYEPSLITIGGLPVVLQGVEPDWAPEEKQIYLPDHPVMYIFGVSRNGQGKQKGKTARACSIGDLERWLERERTTRQFRVGTVAIILIGIALTIVSTTVLQPAGG